MAGSKKPPEETPEEPQEPDVLVMPPTLDERIEAARYAAYGAHGLITPEGEIDQDALIEKVFDIVKDAIVEKPGDRKKKVVTRSQFMERIFPDVPNEAEWADENDPELAKGVYKALNGNIWRLTHVAPDMAVQAKLNGEHGLLLCRYEPRGKEQGAYVTRNRKCLYEDYSASARAAIERAVNQHNALMIQAMDRVPEHAQSFSREFNDTTQGALTSGKSTIKGFLDAGDTPDEEDTDE